MSLPHVISPLSWRMLELALFWDRQANRPRTIVAGSQRQSRLGAEKISHRQTKHVHQPIRIARRGATWALL
jgi:hypothetical protein